jgi:hypothetical protein
MRRQLSNRYTIPFKQMWYLIQQKGPYPGFQTLHEFFHLTANSPRSTRVPWNTDYASIGPDGAVKQHTQNYGRQTGLHFHDIASYM